MKLLEERIIKDGQIRFSEKGDPIIKVGSFLNHQIDVNLLLELGEEVKRRFEGKQITKIVTVEASGIAIATAFAVVLKVPVVFAKKHATLNVDPERCLTARIHSYTHDTDYTISIERDCIKAEDKLLFVDDFLANGEALRGLYTIAESAGADVTGCAIAIEKGFQKGGDNLRREGKQIESLAIIDSIENGKIVFRENN